MSAQLVPLADCDTNADMIRSTHKYQREGTHLKLTTTQIAARIGTSERTAQRWIASGKLKAKPVSRNKYEVNESDLEALTVHDDASDEIMALRGQVSELEQRVEALERQLNTLTPPAPKQKARPEYAATPFNQEGNVSARSFAERHGLTRDQMEGWIKRGTFETTPTPYGQRIQNMLSPTQQVAALAYWQNSGISYTPCEQCPHANQTSRD